MLGLGRHCRPGIFLLNFFLKSWLAEVLRRQHPWMPMTQAHINTSIYLSPCSWAGLDLLAHVWMVRSPRGPETASTSLHRTHPSNVWEMPLKDDGSVGVVELAFRMYGWYICQGTLFSVFPPGFLDCIYRPLKGVATGQRPDFITMQFVFQSLK